MVAHSHCSQSFRMARAFGIKPLERHSQVNDGRQYAA
jgi:hypothetical protein